MTVKSSFPHNVMTHTHTVWEWESFLVLLTSNDSNQDKSDVAEELSSFLPQLGIILIILSTVWLWDTTDFKRSLKKHFSQTLEQWKRMFGCSSQHVRRLKSKVQTFNMIVNVIQGGFFSFPYMVVHVLWILWNADNLVFLWWVSGGEGGRYHALQTDIHS